jgi:thiamine pyrophosphate-dependent acetolactate synthase large subunit-like protein
MVLLNRLATNYNYEKYCHDALIAIGGILGLYVTLPIIFSLDTLRLVTAIIFVTLTLIKFEEILSHYFTINNEPENDAENFLQMFNQDIELEQEYQKQKHEQERDQEDQDQEDQEQDQEDQEQDQEDYQESTTEESDSDLEPNEHLKE